MKTIKKLSALTILSFLLFSCGETEELKIDAIGEVKNEVSEKKEIEFNEFSEKVEYDKKEEKLSIGDSVVIKEGGEYLPKEIEIYKNEKTYENSNVPNYIFYVANEKEEINTIGEYYISMFNKLGYTRIIEEVIIDENIEIEAEEESGEEIPEEAEEDLSRLEFVLENEKYELDENGFAIDGEKEFKQRVLINIYEETPKNIKEGMKLEGRFVEVYYNQNEI